jgi:hypothetical protein
MTEEGPKVEYPEKCWHCGGCPGRLCGLRAVQVSPEFIGCGLEEYLPASRNDLIPDVNIQKSFTIVGA